MLTADDIQQLTLRELLTLSRGYVQFSRGQRKRDAVVHRIIAMGPASLHGHLLSVASEKRGRVESVKELKTLQRKRKVEEAYEHRQKAIKIDRTFLHIDPSHFLDLPTEAERHDCYRGFYVATSNDAVRMGVCGICARELSFQADGLNCYRLTELPNSERLIPKSAHPAHVLIHGRLLVPTAVQVGTAMSTTRVTACNACVIVLSDIQDHPPPLSLANGLWIGDIPWELKRLTFAEQMLIALYYPRVYVFKLFPRVTHAGLNPGTLQRAMGGSVSTYDLDVGGASAMIEGNLLPRKPRILARVLSITFVGTSVVPQAWLRSTFKVRRQAVHDALRWLKIHNTKYYGNINLSQENLYELPEDDVPEEVVALVRHSTKLGVMEEENAGYVPSHDDPLAGDGFLIFEVRCEIFNQLNR